MGVDINKPASRAAELLCKLKKDKKFDPLDELIDLYRNDPDLKSMDRAKICQELMGYVYPKLKAYELDTKANQPVVFNFALDGKTKKVSVE